MKATNTTAAKKEATSTVRDIMKWFLPTNDLSQIKIHPIEPDPCEKIYKRMLEADAYSVFRLSLQTPRNTQYTSENEQ
jgi:hypothetical protein